MSEPSGFSVDNTNDDWHSNKIAKKINLKNLKSLLGTYLVIVEQLQHVEFFSKREQHENEDGMW